MSFTPLLTYPNNCKWIIERAKGMMIKLVYRVAEHIYSHLNNKTQTIYLSELHVLTIKPSFVFLIPDKKKFHIFST